MSAYLKSDCSFRFWSWLLDRAVVCRELDCTVRFFQTGRSVNCPHIGSWVVLIRLVEGVGWSVYGVSN